MCCREYFTTYIHIYIYIYIYTKYIYVLYIYIKKNLYTIYAIAANIFKL